LLALGLPAANAVTGIAASNTARAIALIGFFILVNLLSQK
jgi:hypothetical protein